VRRAADHDGHDPTWVGVADQVPRGESSALTGIAGTSSAVTGSPSWPDSLGKPVLYRSADPLDALEIAIFGHGDELGWHFDNSEFSVTVMYQQPQAGGDFDYCPQLRGEHDENYPGVQQILHGGTGGVRRHPGMKLTGLTQELFYGRTA
jgi:hypothetical protein